MAEAMEAYEKIRQNLADYRNADEISRLERLGDETGVHTLREWEKEM